ncbi:MAG: hypothetical protein ACTTH4_06355 [Prevotella denticola]
MLPSLNIYIYGDVCRLLHTETDEMQLAVLALRGVEKRIVEVA